MRIVGNDKICETDEKDAEKLKKGGEVNYLFLPF